jgi:hypothetical protein
MPEKKTFWDRLKDFTTMWKAGEIIILLTGGLAGALTLYWGRFLLLGITLIGVALFFGLSLRDKRMLNQTNGAIVAQLRQSNVLSNEQRDEVVDRLEKPVKTGRAKSVVAGILFGMLIIDLGFLPVYKWWYKDKPQLKDVKLANIVYFNPAKDEAWLKHNQFFSAIQSHLKKEAVQEGKTARIIHGSTTAFKHDTKPVLMEIYSGNDDFELVGYTFRIRKDTRGDLYEGLELNYSVKDVLGFVVPESEEKDAVFFIAALSLKGAKEFPDDPGSVLKLRIRDVEQKP